MNKYFLAALGAALVSSFSYADTAAPVGERRAEMREARQEKRQQHFDQTKAERLERLKQAEGCVQWASDPKDMKACRGQFREQRHDRRQERRERRNAGGSET